MKTKEEILQFINKTKEEFSKKISEQNNQFDILSKSYKVLEKSFKSMDETYKKALSKLVEENKTLKDLIKKKDEELNKFKDKK